MADFSVKIPKDADGLEGLREVMTLRGVLADEVIEYLDGKHMPSLGRSPIMGEIVASLYEHLDREVQHLTIIYARVVDQRAECTWLLYVQAIVTQRLPSPCGQQYLGYSDVLAIYRNGADHDDRIKTEIGKCFVRLDSDQGSQLRTIIDALISKLSEEHWSLQRVFKVVYEIAHDENNELDPSDSLVPGYLKMTVADRWGTFMQGELLKQHPTSGKADQ